MKQHITPKQASEISEESFYSILNEAVNRKDWANYHHKKITIGKMIEFLFKKGHKITLDNCKPCSVRDWRTGREFCQIEPCDALWELVKSVLKKNDNL